MALMLAKTYGALVEAGASEEKAREAAEEIAEYERRFGTIEKDLADVKGDLRLLKWMVGGFYAVLIIFGAPSVWLLLRVAAKVGGLG